MTNRGGTVLLLGWKMCFVFIYYKHKYLFFARGFFTFLVIITMCSSLPSKVYSCLFIHSVVYLTTGPQPLPKLVLHGVRSSASSFNVQHSAISLGSSSSSLRLLARLPTTYILPAIFPWITCFIRQFPSKMWPIQLAFFLLFVGYFCPLCLL
jgi:hypothetical protein